MEMQLLWGLDWKNGLTAYSEGSLKYGWKSSLSWGNGSLIVSSGRMAWAKVYGFLFIDVPREIHAAVGRS